MLPFQHAPLQSTPGSAALDESFDTREGSLRDPVNEYRSDHEARHERADDRPTRTSPPMLDGNIHAFRPRFESPPHVHPARDTPHVAIADFVGTRLDGHFRYPPRRVAHHAERPPGGHLDGAYARVIGPLEKPHCAIVRQEPRPALDVGRDLEHAPDGRPDRDAVDRSHGHAAGSQAATIRNPARWRDRAGTPASTSRASNSGLVYPRRSDTTASCRVTAFI